MRREGGLKVHPPSRNNNPNVYELMDASYPNYQTKFVLFIISLPRKSPVCGSILPLQSLEICIQASPWAKVYFTNFLMTNRLLVNWTKDARMSFLKKMSLNWGILKSLEIVDISGDKHLQSCARISVTIPCYFVLGFICFWVKLT